MFFIVTSLIALVSVSILYFNETLNPDRKVGGSVDIGYALDYAKEYTTNVHPYGWTTGRLSTTIRIFESLSEAGLSPLLIGFGPGLTTKSRFDSSKARVGIDALFDKFGIIYGLTSMNRIALEYGLLGVISYGLMVVLLAHMCWTYYKSEVDPYWKAFAAGSVGFSFSMAFFFFAGPSTGRQYHRRGGGKPKR